MPGFKGESLEVMRHIWYVLDLASLSVSPLGPPIARPGRGGSHPLKIPVPADTVWGLQLEAASRQPPRGSRPDTSAEHVQRRILVA